MPSDTPTLLAALGSTSVADREAAIARLIILGRKVTPRVLTDLERETDRVRKIALLRVLEGIGDERSLDPARTALAEGGDVALAAIAVLRELLGNRTGATDSRALDVLLALARDPAAGHRERQAAVEALQAAPEDVRGALAPLKEQLPHAATWQDALDGRLPDNPAILREAIGIDAAATPLTFLRRLVDTVAAKERSEAQTPARLEWRSVRGALHQCLALRGSRIGLYDLRDALAEADAPLTPSLLAALNLVGDESCLEPLASAFVRAADGERHLVLQALRAIVRRERLTRRHAAMRRALARAPELESVLARPRQ